MSGIERIIEEIENYIEDCKPSAFSASRIVVNKDELMELLDELRKQVPEEVRQYQKIISNQNAILDQAQREADNKIDQADKLQQQMVSEHEIMQKAYANANKVIEDAHLQAQAIVDSANADAAAMKRSILKYSDDMLASLQTITAHMIDSSKQKYDSFMNSLESNYDIVTQNRSDLQQANSEQ